MTVMRFVAVVLIGCGVSEPESPLEIAPPEAALPGAAIDVVARAAPSITSVTTARGFTQIPQASVVSLVITGKKLGDTTSVAVGPMFTSLDSVAGHELRVSVFTDSTTPLAPLD